MIKAKPKSKTCLYPPPGALNYVFYSMPDKYNTILTQKNKKYTNLAIFEGVYVGFSEVEFWLLFIKKCLKLNMNIFKKILFNFFF